MSLIEFQNVFPMINFDVWDRLGHENFFFNPPPSRSFFAHHTYIVYMVQNVSRMMEYYLWESSGII